MVDFHISLFEPKLELSQVQVECVWVHAPAYVEARLGTTPEPFDPVDMAAGSYKITGTVIDSLMLRVAQVDKAIVRSPAVSVEDTIQADIANYGALERVSRHIWHNHGVDFSIALVDAVHNRFSTRTSSANAFVAPRSEIRLVDFDVSRKWALILAVIGHSRADGDYVGVDCVAAHAGQYGDLGGVQIQTKELENLSEFSLRNS
jgi:hypothetical protein